MNKRIAVILILFFISVIIFSNSVSGATLSDWKDSKGYKPSPILFLHGFATGGPGSWDYVKSGLRQYFDDYANSSTNFLEAIDFNDPNGSIDTYADGRDGWADTLSKKLNQLFLIYRFKDSYLKWNLVCHSMGGLAAREYITNPKYGNSYFNIDKLVTIGTPHAGSPLANIKKVEDTVTGIHKYVFDLPKSERTEIIINATLNDSALLFIKEVLYLNPEGEDVKDLRVGSQFLTNLNARSQPSNIKSYGIYGEKFFPINYLFSTFYPSENSLMVGDGIVPRDSQIGVDIMTNYPDTRPVRVWSFDSIVKVSANHFNELKSLQTVNAIISFLDSTPPQFEITSPGASSEISETSIRLQGKVYKEYLPADSQLVVNITKQEDGSNLAQQAFYLKPSDLWIPNNTDSPVAEFDEGLNFPGAGTYSISCKITNPAGLNSAAQTIQVKVLAGQQVGIFTPMDTSGYMVKSGSSYERARIAVPRVYSARSYSIAGQDFISSYGYFHIYRGFISFDTTGLVNKSIISVKLQFATSYSAFSLSQPNWGSDFSVVCYSSDWGDSLGEDDWDKQSQSLATSVLISKDSKNIILNLPVSAINAGGITQFVLVSSRDIGNLAPTAGEDAGLMSLGLVVTQAAEKGNTKKGRKFIK